MIQLSPEVYAALEMAAQIRDVSVLTLANRLLQVVADDELIEGILDDSTERRAAQ